MKAYEMSNTIRTRCISAKRSSELISHPGATGLTMILFLAEHFCQYH